MHRHNLPDPRKIPLDTIIGCDCGKFFKVMFDWTVNYKEWSYIGKKLPKHTLYVEKEIDYGIR